MAGSQFTISATVNISEIVDVQSLDLTWLNCNGSVVNTTTWSEQSKTNSSGPVVSTLDLVFNTLFLSQAGVYTLSITITDSEVNVTLLRTYQLTVQSKCRFGKCLNILVYCLAQLVLIQPLQFDFVSWIRRVNFYLKLAKSGIFN